jgi:hypothetical protein
MPSYHFSPGSCVRQIIVLILLSCVSLTTAAVSQLNAHEPQVELGPTPEWVKVQDIKIGDFVDLVSPSHYHLVDKQFNGIEGKQAYSRFTYSLTDPSGIESNSNIRIRFNPAYESLKIHDIEVKRLGKRVSNQCRRSSK